MALSRAVPSPLQVFKNLQLFMKNKDPTDDLFDQLTVSCPLKAFQTVLVALGEEIPNYGTLGHLWWSSLHLILPLCSLGTRLSLFEHPVRFSSLSAPECPC